jgi:hypothetical protein
MDQERRSYVLTGTTSPDAWEKLGRVVGGAGLHMQPVDFDAIDPAAFSERRDRKRESLAKLPYHLSEISKAGQYVGVEHFEEFFDERSLTHGKRQNAAMTFLLVTHLYTPDCIDHTEAAQFFGLNIADRHEKGFGYAAKPWNDYVIEAGSLINFVENYERLSAKMPLVGLNQSRFNFLRELANRLQEQIDARGRRIPSVRRLLALATS